MTDISDQIAARLADPAAFRAWLTAQPPETRYRICDGAQCPLAAWLAELDPHAYVGRFAVIRYDRRYTVFLPTWTCRLVERMDAGVGTHWPTPADVIAVLDETLGMLP